MRSLLLSLHIIATPSKVTSPEPVYKRPYPVPVKYHEEIESQIRALEAQGIIRPSTSAYQAPLVPVPKKDGGLRLSGF